MGLMKEPNKFEMPVLIPERPCPTSAPALPKEVALACLKNKTAIAPIMNKEPILVILPITKLNHRTGSYLINIRQNSAATPCSPCDTAKLFPCGITKFMSLQVILPSVAGSINGV